MVEQLHACLTAMGDSKLPLPKDRKIYFYEVFSEKTCAELNKRLMEINSHDLQLQTLYGFYGLDYNPQPIELFIDSPGGYVYPAFGTISIVEALSTPVHTIVTGSAFSAAFLLAIHGCKRYAYEHSTLMYHQPSAGTYGMSKDMEEMVEEVARLRQRAEEMVIKNTKIGISELRDNYEKKKDWYMDAATAQKWGCIDGIIY